MLLVSSSFIRLVISLSLLFGINDEEEKVTISISSISAGFRFCGALAALLSIKNYLFL